MSKRMNKERARELLKTLKEYYTKIMPNVIPLQREDEKGKNELIQALDIAIESLETRYQMNDKGEITPIDNEWTDVRDRLPENDIEVLVTEKYFTNEVTTNRYLTFLGEWETCTDKVIAWKPLPKPYERKE